MTAAALGGARVGTRHFYVWMAAACAVIAIGGFTPTYWAQLPAGTFIGSQIIHVHAVVFTAWPLLFLSQTWLESEGRLAHHRAWGLVGISLATALFFVGAATAINRVAEGLASGMPPDRMLGFLILPISAITLFAGFFAAAVFYRRRTEIHRRLMLLATVPILQAAMGRVIFLITTGGGPGLRPGLGVPAPVQQSLLPGLLIDLLVVAGMLYDWRTRGRPHPVYLIGLAIIVGVQLLRIPVSQTEQWQAFARALVAFA